MNYSPYSWSQRLFLHINKQVGRYPWLDQVMVVCAFVLLWIMVFLTLWLGIRSGQPLGGAAWRLFLAAVCSYITSYCIALVWPHQRPAKELPTVKVLIHTLGTWKSFPSDHTIAAVLCLWFAAALRVDIGYWLALLLLALGVMFGRVYVGVHYPRDILGGLTVGMVFGYLFFVSFSYLL